ncbi:pol polyprotein [Phytophthora cinnamomi]|uniref:pol polyprotein n=1 Tax=Phytophthora cinnamomi TaxID=4785 RepID=UPI00355A0A2F|nr:pol polyprotein [Phytophthora cinnamomi]
MCADQDQWINVLLCVEDMRVMSNTDVALEEFQEQITQHFSMHTFDISDAFVGIELSKNTSGEALLISQGQYTRSVVERFGGDVHLLPRSPTEPGFPSQVLLDTDLVNESFRAIVGFLLYASTVTRPDLALPVRIIAQETERPTATIALGVGRIMGYLARTADASPHRTGGTPARSLPRRCLCV